MPIPVNVNCPGNILKVSEYIGVDFNGDGFHSSATKYGVYFLDVVMRFGLRPFLSDGQVMHRL